MFSGANLHVLYQIANAPIKPFPYPHIYVQDVFPSDFYRELRARLPPAEAYQDLKALKRVSAGYPDGRLVMVVTPENVQALPEPSRSFWNATAQWLLGGPFGQVVLSKFAEFLAQRFGDLGQTQFHDEALLVQDYTTYSLGPHTDSPAKVLSFLFYLPPDDSLAHLGTSIYVPKDPRFRCPGGPHHRFEMFDRMMTAPFLPNTLFAFLKTDNSFHGVEPIQETGVRRDLLLYDIKVAKAPESRQPQPATTEQAASPASKFSF
jgi:hypothetical protein